MSSVSTFALGDLVEDGQLSYGIVQPGRGESLDVPIVRVKDVRDGQIDRSDPLYVSSEVSAKHSRTVLRGGEVLLTLVGTVGQAAVVPDQLAGWNVARAVAVIRPTKKLEAEWLRLCFAVVSVKAYLNSVLNTTVQSTLNLADLKRLTIPVPDQRTRHGVIAVLRALEDKVAANAALARTADELGRSLTVAGLSANYGCLGEIGHTTMGSSPPGKSYNEHGEGVPFFQGVRDFAFRTPTYRIWTTEPVRVADAGDVLVSVRAPVGRLNLSSVESCIGRGLAAVKSRNDRPATLFHLLRHANWTPYEAEGTVFGSINRRQMESLRLPLVGPDRADELEENLSALESLIASYLSENRTLVELRDTLLPDLMSGRLRVKDAELQVEEAV